MESCYNIGNQVEVIYLNTDNLQKERIQSAFKQSGLRDYSTFLNVLKCIAVKAGQAITPSVITTSFNNVLNANISHNTIKKYFDAVEKAGFINKVDRFYIKGTKAKIKNADHIYISDLYLFDYLNQDNRFGMELGAKGEEVFLLSRGRTVFYNRLMKLGYEVTGGRVEYSIRSKKVGSKRIGQNIDFMTVKNDSRQHFVFITKKQREALINKTDESDEFLRAIGSVGDTAQVYIVDVWESNISISFDKIKLLGIETALDSISQK